MIAFSGPSLDRAPAERGREGWVDARRADPRARAVLIGEGGVWIDDGRLVLAPPSQVRLQRVGLPTPRGGQYRLGDVSPSRLVYPAHRLGWSMSLASVRRWCRSS